MTYPVIEKANEFSRDLELAFAGELTPAQLLNKTIDFLNEEVKETHEAIALADWPEIVDGFGDVAFVALNGIYKAFRVRGENHERASELCVEVMKRICEANLGKKQPDGSVLHVNGKVQKPAGWTAPQYADILETSVPEKAIA